MRLRSLGKKGRPDLGALGDQYRVALQANTEEIQRCKRLGAVASSVGRHAPPRAGDSSLGPKSRNVERLRSQHAREALCTVTRGADPEHSALVLADHLVAMGADARTCLSIARAALQATGRRTTARLQMMDASLQEFVEGPGAEQLQTLRSALPGLPEDGITAVPSPGGLCFEFAPSQQEAITQAVAWAMASKEANCSSTLRQFWDQLHMPAPAKSLASAPSNVAPAVCREVGFCVCSDDGKELVQLRNVFISSLKKLCPRQSSMRHDLTNGMLVAKVSGSPVDGDIDAWVEQEVPCREVYFHLGRVRLSPFRCTVHLLESHAAATEHPVPEGVEFVKARMQSHGQGLDCFAPLYDNMWQRHAEFCKVCTWGGEGLGKEPKVSVRHRMAKSVSETAQTTLQIQLARRLADSPTTTQRCGR